ncbi:DUF2924 domain-containing protein [Aurantiacibacter gangjinensis]|uniref:Uncharacterized protein n=1 Tax=Aurantiacibacter gangjinensis TaxID=502682 RepID=A0A0G9MMQ4_9SPHN|nr:DUF2924 domain-containing protein [Aurantiacibacter gangjinensis]APE28049.1 Putative bacteriophage-related protein [Aurantiacibacter gangjinensis]KLE31975.1 hypothetical protein AAW01_11105 [Aurantiacibacter gangjinensis]
MNRLDEQLVELEARNRPELKDRWVKLTGRPAPNVSAALLRLAIGYELQAKALGKLSRKTKQALNTGASSKAITRDLKPGMRLAREHGGKVHVVTIGDAGEIIWNGRQWNSLSEVARAITGTRWSGPAFFGLRDKAKAA